MNTVGLIGGMSWQSSVEYYRIINQRVAERLGGLHSAPILLASLPFHEVHAAQQRGDWDAVGRMLADAGRRLAGAGADFLVIATNTMHKLAPVVRDAAGIPLLHIADATADRIRAANIKIVGLLGTRFTMNESFYRDRLAERHGIAVRTPSEADRELVDRVIYDELCVGELRDESRREYQRIIGELLDAGCEGVILGCTEIGLLVSAADSPVPLFDTARIHAEAAAEVVLGRTELLS